MTPEAPVSPMPPELIGDYLMVWQRDGHFFRCRVEADLATAPILIAHNG